MARPSLRTVAEQAGVSVSSVSNAFNRPDQLSDNVRERILAVASDLGYAGPNPAARSLRTRHVGAIGMLFSTPLEYVFADPYCVELMRGISEVMAEHRTHLVMIPHANAEAAQSAVVDAVIADGLSQDSAAIQAILDRNLPVALSTPNSVGAAVYVDDYAAGVLIGEHLAAQQLWDVTVVVATDGASDGITTDVDHETLYPYSQQRLAGITDGLGEQGTVTVVGAAGNTRGAGAAAGHMVLTRETRPAAIAADSDVLAVGVIDALKRHGLRAGTDIAVTGFDDLPLAEQAGLTTVRQPIRHKGRLLAQSLLDPSTDTTSNPDTTTNTEKTTRLEGVLVPRGSTATEEAKTKVTGASALSNPDNPAWQTADLDLQAYLGRVGFAGQAKRDLATLRALHRAHIATIPFENLALMLGQPVNVDLPAIQHKLVYRQRGGYCYEHNLLMAAVLERLGFTVQRWLARVGDPKDGGRPRSHLVLTTDLDGERWLVDVGFGSGLLEPLPLGTSGAVSQGDWTFNVTQAADGAWHLNELRHGKWATRYSFKEEEVLAVDVQGANHVTSTSPKSPFVQRPILVGRSETREKALIGREFSIAEPDRDLSRGPVSDQDLGGVLAEHFGLRLNDDELATLIARLNEPKTA